MRKVIIASLLVIVIISSLVFIIGPWMINFLGLEPYEYLGTTTYTIDDITPATELSLRIHNVFYPTTISFKEDLEVLLEAKIIVYGKPEHSLENSDKFQGTFEDKNETFLVSFDAGYPKGYEYEIFVNISTHILVALDVDNAYADLNVVAQSANISKIWLNSVKGTIRALFQETIVTNTDEVYISNIEGLVNVTLTNMRYSGNNEPWMIRSREGNVTVGIYQEGFEIQNTTFEIAAEDGEVKLKHNLNSSIGYYIKKKWLMDHNTITFHDNFTFNFIGYPPTVRIPHFSDNYSIASIIFEFYLGGARGVTVVSVS